MRGVPLYIVGAGGAGRETYDAALAAGTSVTAFVDERLAGTVVRGLPVIGADEVSADGEFVIGIADPQVRRRLAAQLVKNGLAPIGVVHPRAIIGPDTTVGVGGIFFGNCHVSSSITIGAHCQVHYNATVGHDTVFADFVTIYPGANISGSVHLETGVTVGSNAVVLQGRTVGADAFVGAGAVVTRDVAPGVVVVGSPARPLSR
jgi:sugar O-acyltransferase (sialic acid O-acetyltransferase NeuD family)